uniref:Cytochrome c oxidase assembly factor 7 homolog n=1 Tax=Hirondellea gigas TaxID=1518452 RepID=A0A2P2I5N9_9CRUS
MAFDLKSEEDVKEYLENIGIEYRFDCYSEKKPESCQLLGEYLESIKNDFDKALKVYKNNCDEYKYPRSCLKYVILGLRGKAPKITPAEAISYLEKGCAAGCGESCAGAAELNITEAHKPQQGNDNKEVLDKAVQMMHRGCELNFPFACYYLSAAHISGRDYIGIKKDMKAAFQFADKACRLGNLEACVNLSQMYMRGDGVEQDVEKGRIYRTKAEDMMPDTRRRKVVFSQ